MQMRIFAAILNMVLLATVLPRCAAGQNVTLEDVVAKHLDSIGTPEARAAVKSRLARGTLKYEVLSGGAGTLEGTATVVSQTKNVREVLKFNSANFRGEDLLSDSNRTQIYKGVQIPGASAPNRSLMGEFLYLNSGLLRDGLFAGTLATSWPLLSPKYHDAKLKYNGLKKVDGRELHEIQYQPKKGSDARIELYFDENFRHVLTIATQTIDARLLAGGSSGLDGNFMGRADPETGGVETANARQQSTRYRLEESFGGFRNVGGLTLPSECNIKFSAEGYKTQVVTYNLHFDEVENNVPLDPRNFEIK